MPVVLAHGPDIVRVPLLDRRAANGENRTTEDARRVLHHPAREPAPVGAPRAESLAERSPVRCDAPGERAAAPVLACESGGEECGASLAVLEVEARTRHHSLVARHVRPPVVVHVTA